MKSLLITFLAVFLSVGLMAHDAEAKRMGGGKSFGMQRSAPTKQEAAPAPQRAQPGNAAATPQKRSWMGPIAGLAAGLGLAALASHLGFGEEMANLLMLALLAMGAFLLFRLLTRRSAPQPAMQYAGLPPQHDAPRFDMPAAGSAPAAARAFPPAAARAFPPGFDAVAFAREAKLNFIRLQAAFDSGNLDDLRAFTTPEVFAELSMQIQERGDAQTTDVQWVEADVLEAVEEGQRLVVSVRFTGEAREAPAAAPGAFDEVWHLVKPAQGAGGWVIAGIQQA